MFRNIAVPMGGELRLFELTDSPDVEAGYYKLAYKNERTTQEYGI